jgi:hypothetical protein
VGLSASSKAVCSFSLRSSLRMNASLCRVDRICCAHEMDARLADRAAFFMSSPHKGGSSRLGQRLVRVNQPRLVAADLRQSSDVIYGGHRYLKAVFVFARERCKVRVSFGRQFI